MATHMKKNHPLRTLMKVREKYLKDLAKKGVKPYDPKNSLDSWKAMRDPYQVKATQEAMYSRANQDYQTIEERRRRQRRERKGHDSSCPLVPSGVPKIMVTAPPIPRIMVTAPSPEIEKELEVQLNAGLEESQVASRSKKKAKAVDKSMTLQVPAVNKITRKIDKGGRPKKASAFQASSKTTRAAASSSKTPPTKASGSKPTKRKASSEDTAPKAARKRFRTKSSRRAKEPDPDQEYRSHWDPFISKHRCSKCNQPVDNDNHCYNGHRITPLKPRTKSGELIREMTQEEMIAEMEAGPPYRQEVYDSEEDDRFGRIQEGMYTDDEEEGYQGYD